MSETYTPGIADAHRAAEGALRLGAFAETERLCLKILETAPRDSHALFLLGVAGIEQTKITGALRALQQAVLLEPGRADYLTQFARCLVLAKANKQALQIAEAAMHLDSKDALILDTLGCVFSQAGEHAKALENFRKATALHPGNPGFQFNLAAALKFNGQLELAEQAYEAAIAADQKSYRAHWALSNLRRQTADNNHIPRLEKLLSAASADDPAQQYLGYALAKEYEDLARYADAFECWRQVNRRRRTGLRYQSQDDARVFKALEKRFTASAIAAARPGHASEEPIFIVGMPRTGTTLVERIISSHSQVFSAGELQNFGLLLKRAVGSSSSRVLDVETITGSNQLDFARLGSEYIQSTRPATGGTARYIDKTPLNFLLMGFIRLALPGATVICLRRHPLDTILSNFRQLFALDFSYYNYAYDLEDTARYYVLFHRLIAHWQEVLPGKLLQVRYEDLVTNQESGSRRLIAHCGLDWEDACLAFERNTAPVATASAVQVREPMYSSAVARWKRYEHELEPARRILEAAGIPIE